MSISSETRRAGPFAGNGSTVNFPFTFKVFTTAQVVVTRTVSGVDTILTLTTDYTVTLNSNQDTSPGGTVTMLTAPASGQSITITSNVANLQPTVLANLGGFYPEVLNDSLDRATIQIQQLDERLDRALVIPVSSTGIDTELPAPESGKLIGWGGTGTTLQNYSNLPTGPTVYQYVHQLIATAGQTVINLPVNYTLGANAITVFLNGLRIEPGSGLDYVETNTTTITFNNALSAGDLVVVAIHGNISTGILTLAPVLNAISSLNFASGDFIKATGPDTFVAQPIQINDVTSGTVSTPIRVAFDGLTDVMAFGAASAGRCFVRGLQICGGDPIEGVDGTLFHGAGHPSWPALTPTKNYSAVELALYPTMAQINGSVTAGGNTITRLAGSTIDAFWVGKKCYFGDGVFSVSAVTSTTITVTNLDGSPVSWGSTFTSVFKFCIIYGTGTCNTSGTAITRLTGEPFVPAFGASFQFRINGTPVALSTVTDPDNAVASSSVGTLTNATFEYWLDINNQFATFRLHNAANDTENLAFYSTYDRYWIESQYTLYGRYHPIVITSGEVSAGVKRMQANFYPDGRVTLGGPFGRHAVDIDPPSANVVNYLRFSGSSTGVATSIQTRGSDANIDLNVDVKGDATVRFTKGQFGATTFEIFPTGETNHYGDALPNADNTWEVGSSLYKWAQVWAVNATIQTSDARTKLDVRSLDPDAMLSFIKALRAVSYRLINARNEQIREEYEVEEERQATRRVQKTREISEVTVTNGRAVQTVRHEPYEDDELIFDEFPLVDEAGAPVMEPATGPNDETFYVQKMARIPRMEIVRVKKTRLRHETHNGSRHHWGLIAQEVKAAMDAAGLDSGLFINPEINGEGGFMGLRYEQLIAPLVAAVTALLARVEALEAR